MAARPRNLQPVRNPLSSIYNSHDGSERGPVALPVFKIGRSPLTRGGWVRLPGASAIRHPKSIRNPQSEIRNDAQDLSGVAEVLQYDVGPRRTEVFDGMASRRHRDRSRAG